MRECLIEFKIHEQQHFCEWKYNFVPVVCVTQLGHRRNHTTATEKKINYNFLLVLSVAY